LRGWKRGEWRRAWKRGEKRRHRRGRWQLRRALAWLNAKLEEANATRLVVDRDDPSIGCGKHELRRARFSQE